MCCGLSYVYPMFILFVVSIHVRTVLFTCLKVHLSPFSALLPLPLMIRFEIQDLPSFEKLLGPLKIKTILFIIIFRCLYSSNIYFNNSKGWS